MYVVFVFDEMPTISTYIPEFTIFTDIYLVFRYVPQIFKTSQMHNFFYRIVFDISEIALHQWTVSNNTISINTDFSVQASVTRICFNKEWLVEN